MYTSLSNPLSLSFSLSLSLSRSLALSLSLSFLQATACSLFASGFGDSVSHLLTDDAATALWASRGVAVVVVVALLVVNLAGVLWVVRLQLVLLFLLLVRSVRVRRGSCNTVLHLGVYFCFRCSLFFLPRLFLLLLFGQRPRRGPEGTLVLCNRGNFVCPSVRPSVRPPL